MKKTYFIIALICVVFLVGCNVNSEKEIYDTSKYELATSESSSEETISDNTTTEQSTTEEPTTEETTTETPTTEEVNATTYTPNGKTPQLLVDVMLNDAEFTFVQMDYPSTEKIATWSNTLSTFNYKWDEFQEEQVKFGQYRVVDLEGDGHNEIVIDIPSTEVLILHYEDNQVYGFMYPWLGVKKIFTSGVMEGAEGGSHTMYSMIEFNKDTYTDTTIAESDYIQQEGKVAYYVEGESVSLDTYTGYISGEKFKEEVPYWSDYKMILTTK